MASFVHSANPWWLNDEPGLQLKTKGFHSHDYPITELSLVGYVCCPSPVLPIFSFSQKAC